uniref:Uncharacterized protein n=1 Tax=Chromera velia CCMP2878 TaxID=1169474 RepID=A0A0G4H550_9ALVE|eukprot:Cvel_836.t1-p1 / transcript=Cvel_836.t1 / gene=Cvel_836 / organism=Chromera_velia_CCMP2878 / gene_product=Putative ankyrin repeat protein MM_0045, putative / transcript_product=Putative ankyrin repeat protein MM_0045, putative / location=Cvel_scaffold26:42430-44576(+) / protein_length=261 / sequence_SO=supercontig / SO=protein_coding / is_pseudo=false
MPRHFPEVLEAQAANKTPQCSVPKSGTLFRNTRPVSDQKGSNATSNGNRSAVAHGSMKPKDHSGSTRKAEAPATHTTAAEASSSASPSSPIGAGAPLSGLLAAAAEGKSAELRTLLAEAKGTPSSAEKDSQGHTPLILSARAGHKEACETILGFPGADLEAQDNTGATALVSAVQCGHTGVVEVLLKAGANVHPQNAYGWTALMFASSRDFSEICSLLLNAGADPRVKNGKGETARCLASRKSNTRVMELLGGEGEDDQPA